MQLVGHAERHQGAHRRRDRAPRDEDEMVREAFTLANLAMHVAGAPGRQAARRPPLQGRQAPAWRPFQLAFVLLNLASLADPNHAIAARGPHLLPDRRRQDRGVPRPHRLHAALRRLRGKARPDEGRGVAVILRYTLRLLTLDQLGRAATLICALEELRRRDPKRLGNARFAVGLWVGQSATANRLKEVHAALNDYTPGRTETPFPLTKCPWCGEASRSRTSSSSTTTASPARPVHPRRRLLRRRECLYTEPKRRARACPVLFVDEQIYQELPDFLVATVDKFAMMPWRGEAGMLFGRATHLDDLARLRGDARPAEGRDRCPRACYPPELIVQDELHLISGPLGTMVGLYETAIDFLSARTRRRSCAPPKILCSTATARRAREQIRALFGREMTLFPPRGIDDGDNFFATVDREQAPAASTSASPPRAAL
jgi:hypothetical protein